MDKKICNQPISKGVGGCGHGYVSVRHQRRSHIVPMVIKRHFVCQTDVPSNGTAPPAAMPLGMEANVWPVFVMMA